MPEIKPRWLLTCSCGWTTKVSSRWAAESAAELHPKLGGPGTAHTVRVEGPPEQTGGQPELPLA
jgi:hypothetical protein